MNPLDSTVPETPPTAARMGAMLVVALLLGLAFNTMNPLGVRWSLPAKDTAASANPAANQGPTSPRGPVPLYNNETLGLSLEAESPTAARAAAVAPVAAPAIAPAPSVVPSVPSLTWPETRQLLATGQIVLVDARAAAYYQTEHIPGAISLPAASSPADFAAFAAKYPKATPFVVYCGSASCPLSNQLVSLLMSQYGYTNIREMPGGFVEYRQVESQAAPGGAR